MPIDFHDSRNHSTYATRVAEGQWLQTIQKYVDIEGKYILDLGCGGGIYSKVFALSGATHVTAMDFSAVERALIHHIADLELCFQEANRVLKPNGKFIIQDRTPEDCALLGNDTHIRGYFFEKHPKLLEKEISRRYSSLKVVTALKQTGFKIITELQYWETRKTYNEFEQVKDDLLNRTGRSILHELSEDELIDLVKFIGNKIGHIKQIKEEDRWTVWIAEKQ